MPLDHRHAPVLEALARYHSSKHVSFSPPGHKQARGADPRVRDVLGDAVFYGDVLASGGLDDRRTGGRILERAEKLMATGHQSHPVRHLRGPPRPRGHLPPPAEPLIVDEAWGAHLPFHPELPTWAMDAGADVCVTSIHKMGSGLEQGSVFHLQGDLIDPALLKTRADLLGTTSPSVLIYAGLDGWRRQMAQHGHDLLERALQLATQVRGAIEEIDGFHVHDGADFCGPGLADDFDPLPVVVDVTGLHTTGYRVADWLREHRHVDVHLADHRRINTQLTHADDQETATVLLEALRAVSAAGPDLPPGPPVDVPPPATLRLQQTCLPRDAFFGPVEDVPVQEAVGRVAAEMITPYPPGIPAVLPGELLNERVLHYLRSGIEAGMNLPDAVDTRLRTVRVMAEGKD